MIKYIHNIISKEDGKIVNVKLDQTRVLQLRVVNIDDKKLPLDNPINHITTNIEGLKKLFPREVDLFILKAVASRMEINSYIFYRPHHLLFEVEMRRIR